MCPAVSHFSAGESGLESAVSFRNKSVRYIYLIKKCDLNVKVLSSVTDENQWKNLER